MEKLSDISKDYLADFEVLTEAKKEFEQQLDKWWRVIYGEQLIPALSREYQEPLVPWENQNRPGICEFQTMDNQLIRIRITDPRGSDRGFYTAYLWVKSEPSLKALCKQDDLVKRLNAVAVVAKVCGPAGLNWRDTELARADIIIRPDDPEETVRQVCDVAVRFFRVVVRTSSSQTRRKSF